MDRRTYESPMDWQYQGDGPLDPTSPFAQAAKTRNVNVFSSPSKPTMRPNPFANYSTPTKQQNPPPPQTSSFTPQLNSRPTAPAFRNPAFTTPRRAFDDPHLSEISAAEDSPGLTEASDFTPEREGDDVVMGGTIVPSKVDKALRYGKGGFLSKKYMSGKGEIKAHRHVSSLDVLRKRKRHNQDRDVSSVVRYLQDDDYGSEFDSDTGFPALRHTSRSRNKAAPPQPSILTSLFKTMDEHPNAPENLYRWVKVAVNVLIMSIFLYIGWSVVDTVQSDIRHANEAARMELMSRLTECQSQYHMNGCANNDRPALRLMCEEWYDCMMQDPKAIMKVRVTAKQIAEVINEFTEAMNLKAWGIFFAVLIISAFANNMTLGRHVVDKAPQPTPSFTSPMPDNQIGHDNNFMWVPVQTPRAQRQMMLEDGTDTDSSPPKMKLLRSPTRRERMPSPVKHGRSLSPVKNEQKY